MVVIPICMPIELRERVKRESHLSAMSIAQFIRLAAVEKLARSQNDLEDVKGVKK